MTTYQPLNEHVYDYIIALINDGNVKPGERVSEQSICEAMNVSRTPVREALIKLCDDGYLDNRLRRGFYVRGFDAEVALGVMQVMAALDAQAASLACDRLMQEDYQQMQFMVDSMNLAIEGGLLAQYYELQHNFHGYYIARCGNERLISLVHQQQRYFVRRDFLALDIEKARATLLHANKEHEEIVRLFRAKDSVGLATFICTKHWSNDYIELFKH